MLKFTTIDDKDVKSKWCFGSMKEFAKFYHEENYIGPSTDDYVLDVEFCGEPMDIEENEIEIFYDIAKRFYWGCTDYSYNKIPKGKPVFTIKTLSNGWSIVDNRTNLRAVSRDNYCVQDFLQWASRYIQPLRKVDVTRKWLKWYEKVTQDWNM